MSANPNYSQYYGENLPQASQGFSEQTAYWTGGPSSQQLPFPLPQIHTAFDSSQPGGGAYDPNVVAQSPMSPYTGGMGSPSSYSYSASPTSSIYQAASQQEQPYMMPAMGGSNYMSPMQTPYASVDPSMQMFQQSFGQGFNFYESAGMPGGFAVPQGFQQATDAGMDTDMRKAIKKNIPQKNQGKPLSKPEGAKLGPQKKKLFPCC